MSSSTFTLSYHGTNSPFAMSLRIDDDRVIAKIFQVGESLDITNMCTPDELYRNAEARRLIDSGLFSQSYVEGTDDFTEPKFVQDGGGGGGTVDALTAGKFTVHNVNGSMIPKGSPLIFADFGDTTKVNVYVGGPRFAGNTAYPVIALAHADIPDDEDGLAVRFGLLTGFDTSSMGGQGNEIYVDTDDALTTTLSFTKHMQFVGYVASDDVDGSIFVNIATPFTDPKVGNLGASVRLIISGGQDIDIDNAPHTVTWATAAMDENPAFFSGVNPTRITIPVGHANGRFRFVLAGSVALTGVVGATYIQVVATVVQNGTDIVASSTVLGVPSATTVPFNVVQVLADSGVRQASGYFEAFIQINTDGAPIGAAQLQADALFSAHRVK